MADSPIAFIIMGILMVVFSKAVTNLHMKMLKWQNKNLFKAKENDLQTFYKAYRVFFLVMWLGLGIAMIIFHGAALLQSL